MSLLDSFLLAMASPQQGSPNPWLQLLPFALILGIFYFVMVMPMRKRQQKVQAFLAAVITSGGIYGQITRVKEDDPSVQLQIANNVRIDVSRAAIVGYQGKDPVVPEGNQP
jgi:preprotein translocase subunit YajC